MDLKVGDIVKLKTGGPNMTVNRTGPVGLSTDDGGLMSDEVETTWFSPARTKEGGMPITIDGVWEYVTTQRFGADALEKVSP